MTDPDKIATKVRVEYSDGSARELTGNEAKKLFETIDSMTSFMANRNMNPFDTWRPNWKDAK